MEHTLVTRKSLAGFLGVDKENIKQFKHCQCFIVSGKYLYSYKTLIGRLYEGTWYISTKKYLKGAKGYSRTTPRHIEKFRRLHTNTVLTDDAI